MFEQQMSQSIEAGAPDITYSGNEGPKSPQQMQQMMKQQMMEQEEQMMAPVDYSSRAYRDKLIQQLMDTGGLDYGSAANEADRIIKIKLRPKAAYGGIMGLDGRRKYGLGSKFKKFVRKIIPNEVAEIAVKAAPFVAPFNPIAAGLMSGIGGFDQTGKIGSSLKSGLMNYGMGQLARGVGGGTGNLQTGFNPAGGMQGAASSGFGKYFTSPVSSQGGLGKMFSDKFSTAGGSMVPGADPTGLYAEGLATGVPPDPTGLYAEGLTGGGKTIADIGANTIKAQSKAFSIADLPGMVKKNLMKAGLGNNLMTGLLVGGLGAGALMGNMTEEEIMESNRGEGMDVEAIRTEVLTAMKDPSGDALKAIRIKYPFLGTQRSKDVSELAYGGRIGFEDGGLTEYEAYRLKNMGYDTKGGKVLEPFGGIGVLKDILRVNRANGGLMNLGGMEKDYRAEGGFVPIGAKEKADDVPARLSVNEFVFTADAVRGAGQGDIDKGAEIMENMMKHLEQGGQVSEESQGMAGARDMFETSQRLSEVV